MTRRVVVALLALAFVLAGCGQEQKIGSDKLLDFEQQEDARRLGEATDPPPAESPTSLTVVDATPAPAPTPAPTPPPRYFDVTLVADSPFYEPGNALVVIMGATLRVTNADGTPERTTRSFTDEAGSFDSGPLGPGQSWSHLLDTPGRYRIKDSGLPFASATLEVRAG